MQTESSLARQGPLESLQPQQAGPRPHIDIVVRGGAAAGSDVTLAIQAARGTRLRDIWTDVLTEADVEPGAASIDGKPVSADAVLGLPPLLHGAVLDIGRPFTLSESAASAESSDPSGAAATELRVCSGPDAGAVRALPTGSYRVGREGCDVSIDDAEISRAHALIHVDTQPGHAVSVQDVGSTNGVVIDDRPLGSSERADVHPAEPVRIGSSTLRVGPAERDPVVRRCDGSGTVQVNRPPRSRPSAPRAVVTLPSPPETRSPSRPPMAALAVPLLVGVALAIATGTAAYLLFVILSPLMLLSSWLGDRITARRERRSHWSAYERDVARAELEVAAALRREHRWRHAAHPDLAELLLAARGHRAGLWRRQPADEEFLALRIGLGTATARLEVRTDSPGGAESRQLPDVPVTVTLPSTGVLGVAGPSPSRNRLTRALVAQVAGLHSPRDVGLVVLADDTGWSWTSWLPHVLPPSGGPLSSARVAATDTEVQVLVDELVAELDRHDDPQMTARRTVLLALGGSTLRAAAGGARLLAEGPAAGIYVICCDATVSALPIECTATVELAEAPSTQVRVDCVDGTSAHGVVLDGVSLSWAVDFARTLAPLRDLAPDGRHDGLPTDVRLVDLLDVDACDSWSLAAAWTGRRRCTRVPIGVGAGGDAVVVDVAADGPHVLVAGTTGSGKSELLQTLVSALATVNRPDELVFVLVDYKGGAAFRECALLPHSVGLVTDLDGHLTSRALRSLDAELRRRERVLRDAGVPDIASYVRQAPGGAHSGDERLPRLVIVVDEFATLADELPDFVHGLVGIAQRGRSLGVHLVLATQRPAGVVSADIRANTSLRIALRVSDLAESVDVLESSAAAALPRGTPGRAAMRFGGDPVRLVQVASVGGVSATHRQTEVRRTAVGTAGIRDATGRPRGSSDRDEVSDLARLVSAVGLASAAVGGSTIPSPWLPPLPTLVSVDDLGSKGAGTSTRPGVPIGLQDVPAEQRRRVLTYALDGGDHLLVVGSPGVGRTTTLRTVAAQLARHHTTADLHLHAIDPGDGLSWLTRLPQCGTVVGRHDPDRAARLVQRLGDELDRRQRILAAQGCGSIEEYRDGAPHPELPIVVLLVDGWQAVRELLEQVDDGHPVHQLDRLLREGAAAGLRLVLSGDRDALSGRACAGIADRLLLPLRDPADYALAGVPRNEVPTALIAGRALAGPVWTETQLAVLGADGSGAGQRAALDRIAAAAHEREAGEVGHGIGPIRLQSLPRTVELTELLQDARDRDAADPGWTLVGVGGDAVVPVGLDLSPDRPAAVIAGPPGSGRTNALAVLARWCQARGRPVLLVSDPRSPLHRLAGEPGVVDVGGFDRAEPLTAALASHPGGVVLVDDADLLQGSVVEPALLSVLHRDRAAAGASLVLAGTTTDLAAAFRGVVAEARRGRTGLLLGPHSPVDGDLLGVRVPRVREAPPGRGLLVQDGRALPVQVASAGLAGR